MRTHYYALVSVAILESSSLAFRSRWLSPFLASMEYFRTDSTLLLPPTAAVEASPNVDDEEENDGDGTCCFDCSCCSCFGGPAMAAAAGAALLVDRFLSASTRSIVLSSSFEASPVPTTRA